MKTEVKVFPRTFCSSSAAYRAIRQYEEKHLNSAASGLVMTKIDSKNFLVSLPTSKMSVDEFNDKRPNVVYTEAVYRYYPDGVKGDGYYEQKTGDRRRPNSKHISVQNVYNDLITDTCKL